jgi:type IV pilus assembly protein PilZ
MVDVAPKVVRLSIKIDDIDSSYLSFIEGGGLFIPTLDKDYRLGNELFVEVELEGQNEPLRLIGKIVWLTTSADSQDWPLGVGIQFQDEVGSRLNNLMQTFSEATG